MQNKRRLEHHRRNRASGASESGQSNARRESADQDAQATGVLSPADPLQRKDASTCACKRPTPTRREQALDPPSQRYSEMFASRRRGRRPTPKDREQASNAQLNPGGNHSDS